MANSPTPPSTARAGSHDPTTVFVRTVAEARRLAHADALNDPAVIAGATTFTHTGTGAVTRLIVDRLNDTINAADFGVIGDSFTDDTAAAQAALNASATQNKIVNFNGLTVRITAGLTCSGPGLFFDAVPHGSGGGPGFFLDGSGYTGLTFTGTQNVLAFTLFGNGQVANGVYFNNPQRTVGHNIRVYNLNGFGIKIDQEFDCSWLSESVELCGNTSVYAYSVNAGGGTSNMSHHHRIQVEQANAQAIFIDPATLSCVFDNIHSERLIPNAGFTSWSLQGASCIYNGFRLNSAGTSANASVLLSGEHCQYNAPRIEGNIVVSCQGASATSMTITDANIQGTLKNVVNQTGNIEILGSTIATMTVDPYGIRCFGTQITTLTMGVGPNPLDPTQARFENCDIGTLVTGASLLAAATFVNCRISEGNNLLKGWTVLLGCVVTFAGTCTVQAPLYAKGTYFIGNLNTNGLAVFDDGCTLTGTASGSVAPTAGTWQTGQITRDLSGASQGAMCTAGGTPGTWSTIGGALAHTLTIGAHLTGGSFNGSANVTIATDAVSTNTASTIVLRDGSGNFAAGTITASLIGTATAATTTTAAGVASGTFGSGLGPDTGSYSFPSTIGVGTSGTTTSAINIGGTITASGGVCRGITMGHTMVAAANNDILQAVRIQPTLTPGAFTGVQYFGINLPAVSVAAFASPSDPAMINIGVLTGTGATNASGIKISAPTGATNNYSVWALGNVRVDGTMRLGAAYSAGVVAATGTIAIQDSSGTTYNMLVHT